MKKSIFSILACLSLIGCNGTTGVSIVDYKPEHKDAVIEISFQDSELFFPGYLTIPVAMRDQVDIANKKQMVADCDEPLKYKKILLSADGKVVAFAIYFKVREQSLESVRKTLAQQMPGQAFTDEQLLAMNSDWKKTEDECGYFALLESIAVSKDFRGKGYGKKLIKIVFEECEQKLPDIVSVIKLHVNETNPGALKLYESEGFVRSQAQPMAAMKVAQYEKKLK